MGDTKADVIYRQKGRVTTTRVLPSEGTSRRFESSIEGTGTLAGHNINGIITYTSNSVSQDSFTGVAYGILTAQEGGDTAFLARLGRLPPSCGRRRAHLAWLRGTGKPVPEVQ